MPTSTGGTTYSDAQVYQLMQGTGTEAYVFDWLSPDRSYKGDLTSWVLSSEGTPRLADDATAAVHRTMRFTTLSMPSGLAPLTDIIRPHYRLLAPDGGWLDWTLGTLTLNQPHKSISAGYSLYQWEATECTDLLAQDEFLESFSAAGGALGAISSIITGMAGPVLPALIPMPGDRIPGLRAPQSWDRGKSRLEAINDILKAIGYRPLWADELGQLRSSPLVDYNLEVPPWTWDARTPSIVLSSPFGEEPDPGSIINTCVAQSEDSRTGPPIFAMYENTRPDSPASVPVLKRRRVKVIKDSSISDFQSAWLIARAAVQEGARLYSKFTMETVQWPVWASGNLDTVHYVYSSMDEGTVDANYVVLGWSMDLTVGGSTQHVLQRIVPA